MELDIFLEFNKDKTYLKEIEKQVEDEFTKKQTNNKNSTELEKSKKEDKTELKKSKKGISKKKENKELKKSKKDATKKNDS